MVGAFGAPIRSTKLVGFIHFLGCKKRSRHGHRRWGCGCRCLPRQLLGARRDGQENSHSLTMSDPIGPSAGPWWLRFRSWGGAIGMKWGQLATGEFIGIHCGNFSTTWWLVRGSTPFFDTCRWLYFYVYIYRVVAVISVTLQMGWCHVCALPGWRCSIVICDKNKRPHIVI